MASAPRPRVALAFLLLVGGLAAPTPGPAAAPEPPLVPEAVIPLPDVRGRIDHMAVDLKRGRLVVAEFGNNTADIVDIAARKAIRRIAGLSGPQGVGYAERGDLVLVANAGDGALRLFRGEDLAPAGEVRLGEDADNVRIEPRNGLAVVGFGDGGLALIDPVRRARVAEVRLPVHPEGFQIDPQAERAFVNLPDVRQIAAVDLTTRRIVGGWQMRNLGGNFPMALDPASRLLAVVFRDPPVLVLLDRDSGAVRGRAATCGDADDVFFDGRRHRIYISCGAGAVAAFAVNGGPMQALPSVATAPGARTSLFVPDLDRLFVARPAAEAGAGAAILVYRPAP